VKRKRKRRTITDLMNKGWRTIYRYGKESAVLEKGKYHLLYDVRKHRVLVIYRNMAIHTCS